MIYITKGSLQARRRDRGLELFVRTVQLWVPWIPWPFDFTHGLVGSMKQ